MLDVELSRPLPDQLATTAPALEALIRLHGEPIGLFREAVDDRLLDRFVRRIESELAAVIDQHLRQDGLEAVQLPMYGGAAPEAGCVRRPTPTSELVSVVIPTAGRPVELGRCLDSILASTHDRFEVLVVDNRPLDGGATKAVVEAVSARDGRVRYLSEPEPGASRARNTGIAAAQGDVLAFTDDDVVVDPEWLAALLRGLGRTADVVCVGGLTLALQLETPAQLAFEVYGAWPRGFTPRIYDLKTHRGDTLLYPWTAGVFGASNNLAVRRSALVKQGNFETRLGPATPTHGAEDLNLLLGLVLAGGVVGYEPAALVRHLHRRDMTDFCWQVFTYSVGMTALLTRWALREKRLAPDILRRLPGVLRALRRPADVTGTTSPFRDLAFERRLRWLEVIGYLYGPIAWLRSRRLT